MIPGYSSHGTVFVPWATFLLSSLALFAYLQTGAAPVEWVFDRTAIAKGEWWRLLTGHWVHSDDSHALWNIAALVLLGLVSERSMGNWMPVALIMATAAVDAWLWWEAPHLQQYCGLSGILNGLLAAVLARQWQLYKHPLILLIGAGALVKIALEIMSGQAIFTQTAWPSVPETHAAGLLGGLVAAALQTNCCRPHLCLPVTGSPQYPPKNVDPMPMESHIRYHEGLGATAGKDITARSVGFAGTTNFHAHT